MSSNLNSTRRKILSAAWALLEAQEPGKVRLGDIAKRAGISRQALYLHFANRADLLVETARYIDAEKDIDGRLAASRKATSGRERLRACCNAWAEYLPEIQGVGRAFMAMEHSDKDARAAWADRMGALREGCAAAVAALSEDADLSVALSPAEATDVLWTLMSLRNWLQLTQQCGWTQSRYQEWLVDSAERLLLKS